MDDIPHVFEYEKSIVLSGLYDTLDMLGFSIEQANSERGTIIAVPAGMPDRRIRIACSSILNKGKTSVQFFPDIRDETGECISRTLLDELNAILKRSHEEINE